MSQLAEVSAELAEVAEQVVAPWIERAVLERGPAGPASVERAAAAGRAAADDVLPRLRSLLVADIDDQRTTPLAILRDAVRHATAALRDLGAAPVARDEHDRAIFPDDDYGLTPASFADVDERLAEPGLRWGAAKAFEHRRRHGSSLS